MMLTKTLQKSISDGELQIMLGRMYQLINKVS